MNYMVKGIWLRHRDFTIKLQYKNLSGVGGNIYTLMTTFLTYFFIHFVKKNCRNITNILNITYDNYKR